MEQYHVTGMNCAACSARVEKAVTKVPGVTTCSVSLLTNSMGVEGTAESSAVIEAVKAAGYGASLKNAKEENKEAETGLEDTQTPLLKKRLIASVIFLIVLMYFSMGHMMWGWPLSAWFTDNHVGMGLVQMILAAIIMVINQQFFISGFKALWHRSPNMDTLVAMGSMASFVWSVYVLLAMTRAQTDGNAELVMEYMMEFYFESAAMILTLITVGKMLEARSKGKTTDALKSLISLAPKTAVVERDGKEVTVSIDEVQKGDIFVVRPGENIPVDGQVIEGNSAVNEAAITGESIPVDKAEGDMVRSATINQSGFLRCRATRVGEDTTLSQIIKLVEDASATKAPIAKVADKVSGVFVPVVITIAVITTLVWLLAGQNFAYALARGISVLVISCPCALGLATPVAIMVGNGMGAKNGILFKTAVSLEETGKTRIVALDKTGTITRGEPKVTDVLPAEGISEEELLTMAYTLEQKSEHPLAKAVLEEAQSRELKPRTITDFTALPGNGLSGKTEGSSLLGGSYTFIREKIEENGEKLQQQAEQLAKQGKTPLLFVRDGKLLGMIAVADVIKEDSPQAIAELQNMGIKVVMLTGDNEQTARAIGKQAGVDEVIAGVLPDGKEQVISSLKQQGKTIMVGDGINDAPALTRADIGIAIGAGADIAMDAADIVLMKSRLSDIPAAIRLSRATLKNIHENLFWAFFYNVIGIPLAAGVWIPLFGWKLNPMFGALAMSLSSFCVVSNALRLNLFRMYDASKDKKVTHKSASVKKNGVQVKEAQTDMESVQDETLEGDENMIKTTVKVDGMMCGMCESHVNDAVRNAIEVKKVSSSHKKGTTEILTEQPVDEEKVKAAIEATGYKVLGITTGEAEEKKGFSLFHKS